MKEIISNIYFTSWIRTSIMYLKNFKDIKCFENHYQKTLNKKLLKNQNEKLNQTKAPMKAYFLFGMLVMSSGHSNF